LRIAASMERAVWSQPPPGAAGTKICSVDGAANAGRAGECGGVAVNRELQRSAARYHDKPSVIPSQGSRSGFNPQAQPFVCERIAFGLI
jgi:hypothetical protein